MMNVFMKRKVKVPKEFLVTSQGAVAILGISRQALLQRAKSGMYNRYYIEGGGNQAYYDLREICAR